ncbi:unnamed protein product [Linum trigynum]
MIEERVLIPKRDGPPSRASFSTSGGTGEGTGGLPQLSLLQDRRSLNIIQTPSFRNRKRLRSNPDSPDESSEGSDAPCGSRIPPSHPIPL